MANRAGQRQRELNVLPCLPGASVTVEGSEENPLTREGPHTGSQEAAYLSSRARSDFGAGVA